MKKILAVSALLLGFAALLGAHLGPLTPVRLVALGVMVLAVEVLL